MTNSENISSSPNACCVKKGPRCFRILLGIALVAAAGYVALACISWQTPVGVVESGKLGAIEQRLDAVEKQLGSAVPTQATGSPIPLGPLTEEVDKLKAQVENKDSQNQMIAQKFIAEAFAFWDLREAVRGGLSFAPQLAALRTAAAGNAQILDVAAKLDAYALVPPLTIAQLRESFAAEAKTAASPAVEPISVWEKIKALLAPLISMQPLHDPRFASVERALEFGNAAAALEAVRALPDDLQKGLATWQAKLEARIALDDAVQALATRFTTPPAQAPILASPQAPAQVPAQESAPQ